jgi:site-specific DNA recombinase
MMRDIRAGKIDVVVVAIADRLRRQPMELEKFIVAAKKVDMTRLRTDRSREYDLTDYDAIQDMRKEVIDAAYEVDRLRYGVTRGMRGLAEKGVWSGGARPNGYESDGMTVRESGAFYIREAVTRIPAGGSLYSLQRDWADKVPTSHGNCLWSINWRLGLRHGLKQCRSQPTVENASI